jgi:ATP-binding cassette, subfamily B, bacterial
MPARGAPLRSPCDVVVSPWVLARRSLRFVRPFRARVVVVLGLALLLAAVSAAEPLLTMHLIDALQGPRRGTATPMHFLRLACALAVLEGVRILLDKRLEIASWRVRIGVDFAVREAIVARLTALPVAWHERETVGGTMQRVNHAVTGFTSAFGDLVFRSVPALVYLVLALTAMVRLEWHLSLLVLVAAPLPAIVGAWAAAEQTARERALLTRWTGIYSRLNEVLAGIRTVKGFGMERAETRRFLDATAEVNGVVTKGVSRDALTGGIRSAAASLARLGALLLGGWYVWQGELTVGALVAFLGYIHGLFGPVEGLTSIYQTARKAVVALETIWSILDAPDPVADVEQARACTLARGAVRFEGVTFGYDPQRPVLNEITLDVKPGERVAFVGPSGSGKTTLMALLERLHPVASGRILVDGVDIRQIAADSLHAQIGVVFQDVHLFNESVRANLAYGTPHATPADIERVARAAQMHATIMALPEGYDTVIGERGSRLSGGQRQRLAIARAMLRDPAILILDEATSALDTISEAAVQDALRALMAGRTTLVVAHRLSTIEDADRIVVLRHGRIEAIGTHLDLLQQSATYRAMNARPLQAA